MADEVEEDEFELQLRQEELARLAKEDGAALSRGLCYTDDDGTVMEWDYERKAYFPKIDADFIAQYQINYGTSYGQQASELTEDQKKSQSEEYWRNYYNVYSKEQPPLPKLDDEGNPVEEEEDDEGKEKKSADKVVASSTKQTPADNTQTASSFESSDPTSDEHYEYNLYYYGKEYADQYRDYYKEHPDAEALPDFIAQSAAAAASGVGKKQDDGKKGKKKKEETGEKRKEPPREEGWFEIDPESSTQVYVSELPLDITDDEFKELMSKCGLVMFDPLTQKPKLKLYKDQEGNMKGDGLCTYIKPESVTLAFQLLDGKELRGKTISVERARFELKGQFDPKKKKKKLSNKAKQKMKEKQQKLFDWRFDKSIFQRGKHERTVILKNMFNIQEFEENPALINELRADVREECQKFGDVKKVFLYDRNPEGVISVTFKEPEEADACIAALNGRWFAKNRVVAFTHDGKTKYDVVETEEERAKRLKDWEAFLEGKKRKEDEAACAKAAESDASCGFDVQLGGQLDTDPDTRDSGMGTRITQQEKNETSVAGESDDDTVGREQRNISGVDVAGRGCGIDDALGVRDASVVSTYTEHVPVGDNEDINAKDGGGDEDENVNDGGDNEGQNVKDDGDGEDESIEEPSCEGSR
ncbi:unnamed protein product [Lymnaea stagnalis]|uniref:17S U2 SnRNP complex component HTATSF1 n=1 Tax=Lymnaea stagnalis TaxID=6523 RepID=A0AAV2HFT2_LYMST